MKRTPWGIAKPPPWVPIDWSHPLAKGLVGAWTFREGSGLLGLNPALGQSAVATGTPTWPQGDRGPVLGLSGTGQYLTVADHPALDFAGDLSIVARFRTTNATAQMIYGGYLTSSPFTGIGFGIGFAAGGISKLAFWSSTKSAWIGGNSTACTDGNWHTGAVSVAGTNARFYLDGDLDAAVASAAGSAVWAGNKLIGGNSTALSLFNGQIDHLLLYQRAIDAGAMSWLAAEPNALFLAPPRRRGRAAAAGFAPWLARRPTVLGPGVY